MNQIMSPTSFLSRQIDPAKKSRELTPSLKIARYESQMKSPSYRRSESSMEREVKLVKRRGKAESQSEC